MNPNSEKESITFLLPDKDAVPDYSFQTQVDALDYVQQSLSQTMESISTQLLSNLALTNLMGSAVNNLVSNLYDLINPSNYIGAILDGLNQLSDTLIKSISELKCPTFSESEMQKMLESHQQWGKFGWTWFPNMNYASYIEAPGTISEANAKMRQFCSTENLQEIFNSLRKYPIRKDDLESAIFCFKNKQYKACSLLLFGLIDSRLIRLPSNVNRSVGKGAVTRFGNFMKETDPDPAFFSALYYANLIAFLETIFANGNNFYHEPVVINRNFIGHGMSTRRTRKRDCIQLFVALFNVLLVTES